jgi:hypothetical protein
MSWRPLRAANVDGHGERVGGLAAEARGGGMARARAGQTWGER